MQPSPDFPSSRNAPALDFDHLDQQTLGDRDLQAELLGLFAEQAKRILAALDGSGRSDRLLRPGPEGPAPRAADLLHTLCGSARAVGSWQVATQAEAMEHDLRRSGAAAAGPQERDRLLALGRSVAQVCAVIDDLSHRSPS